MTELNQDRRASWLAEIVGRAPTLVALLLILALVRFVAPLQMLAVSICFGLAAAVGMSVAIEKSRDVQPGLAGLLVGAVILLDRLIFGSAPRDVYAYSFVGAFAVGLGLSMFLPWRK